MVIFGLFAFPYGFEHIVDDFRRNSFGPTRSQSLFQVNFEVVLRPLASSSRVGDFSVVGGHEQLTFQCNQNVQYESELSFCLCIELFDRCSTEMDYMKF